MVDRVGRNEAVGAVGLEELLEHLRMRRLVDHHLARRIDERVAQAGAEDEQAAYWQSDASNYLRLLDAKPVRIVVKARSVMPNMFDPHLLQVEGDLLEWDSYARPMAEQFSVRVADDDIDALIDGLERTIEMLR